jgi:hypothetical protein
MTACRDNPAAEFAALVSDQPASEPTDSIYAGLDDADAFALALHFAGGGRLGVPDSYQAGDTTQPDENAPRRPRPDKSQGAHRPAPRDPATLFADRVLGVINYPPRRWRDL